MCGVVAVYAHAADAAPVSAAEVVAIREAMLARGPDGAGLWQSDHGRVALGHRRLAILDTSTAGAQPMRSASGHSVITYNGEIYNFRQLREELEQQGQDFRSQSDTEVLLALYERDGPAMLDRLRGMYAFALWDQRRKGLFLARDPLGIKPLYYSDDGRCFRAASQVKALLAGRAVDSTPEPAGHAGFFLWGYVPDPFTLYAGIRSLPAGHSLWVGPQGPEAPRRFFSLTETLSRAERQDPAGDLATILRDSVAAHLVSDVPVGVFLSAGLDSTSLAALASEAGGELRTLTLGFAELAGGREDEVPLAEAVARELGSRHETHTVRRADFAAALPTLLDAMDQPSIDGTNSFFVARAAHCAGLKVALSGLGGDELFGSYGSFRQVPATARRLAPAAALPGLGRAFRLVSAPLLRRLTSPKWAGLLEYGGSVAGAYLLRRGLFMPWELPRVMDPAMAREGWRRLDTEAALNASLRGIRSDHLRVAALEMAWYMRGQLLRDADWAGMAHSVEIRVPLVDVAVLRDLAPHLARPGRPGKAEMARAPSRALPAAVLQRPKSGFVVPIRRWLAEGAAGDAAAAAAAARGLRGWAKLVYAGLRGQA